MSMIISVFSNLEFNLAYWKQTSGYRPSFRVSDGIAAYRLPRRRNGGFRGAVYAAYRLPRNPCEAEVDLTVDARMNLGH